MTRESHRNSRRSRPVVLVMIVGLACVAAIALALRRPGTTPPSPTRAPIVAPVAASAPPVGEHAPIAGDFTVGGPSKVVGGVPMGYAHSAAGAEAGAVQFLLFSQALVGMTDGAAADAQRVMSSTSATDRLVEDLLQKLAALRGGFPGGRVGYRIGPVASRVSLTGPDRATAEIWYVSVVSPPKLPPYEEWRTVRYDLVWEQADWRIEAETSVAGPRPVTLPGARPSGPGQMEAALMGFGPIGAAQ